MIKPTIGRIVLYYQYGKTQYDAGDQPEAAIVTHVWGDEMVNLCVFNPNGVPYPATSTLLYQGEGDRPYGPYAEWMPYQISQAKAQAVS